MDADGGSLVLLVLLIRLVALPLLYEVPEPREDHLLYGQDPQIEDFWSLDLHLRPTTDSDKVLEWIMNCFLAIWMVLFLLVTLVRRWEVTY